MVKVNHQPIPMAKMYQFHEILCAFGGRYLCNPYQRSDDVMIVDYTIEDYEGMSKAWMTCITPIVEIQKVSYIKKVINFIKGKLV